VRSQSSRSSESVTKSAPNCYCLSVAAAFLSLSMSAGLDSMERNEMVHFIKAEWYGAEFYLTISMLAAVVSVEDVFKL
jgi:hypothetical protein